ncbi:MAG TPA: glycosyltransferase family 87 protein, partial [Thermomicrobiales bacterium]|nr:glycosyltransferase family 87 protein [Thermomicrobiales bacterium]
MTSSLIRERLERLSVALDRQLAPKRIRMFAICVLTFWSIVHVGLAATGDLPYNKFNMPILADLTNRFIGADILLNGDADRLYDLDRQTQSQRELFSQMPSDRHSLFVSPPFVAYIYAPLALLPYTVSAVIWLLVSVALVFLSLRLLWPIVPDVHRHGISLIMLLLFASQPMIELLGSGQDAALSLFVLAAGLRLLLSGREGLAGAVLGLGLFKPQIFVFMPIFFLVTRRWRALAGWLAVAA